MIKQVGESKTSTGEEEETDKIWGRKDYYWHNQHKAKIVVSKLKPTYISYSL